MTESESTDLKQTLIQEGEPAGASSRFRIVKCLGSGGMGDVYLAEDSKLQRPVAIKTIRADLCKDEELRKRIERECLLHAKIGSHPHIVTLFDRLEHGERINLIMEYVEGQTLQEVLEQYAQHGGRLPWKEGVTIAAQCLEALSRIHAHNIVHRDIKPSNILLARDDSGEYCAKLMDFGIARMQDERQMTALTQDGTGGPGTPLYMAPEQIDPMTFGPVSPATDVYAMGVMLYQILSGKAPFTGSITEIFNGHLNRQPPPIDFEGDVAIPPGIADILKRALAKRPAARFPSAKAFREALLSTGQRPIPEADSGGVQTMPLGAADANRTLPASDVGALPREERGTMLATGALSQTRGKGARFFVLGGILLAAVALAAGSYVMYTKLAGLPTEPAREESASSPASESLAAQPAEPTSDAVSPPVGQTPGAVSAGLLPEGTTPPQESVAPLDAGRPLAARPEPPSDDSHTRSALEAFLDHQQPEEPAAPPQPEPKPPPAQPKPQVTPAPEPAVREPKPEPPGEPVDQGAEDESDGWTVIRKEDRRVE